MSVTDLPPAPPPAEAAPGQRLDSWKEIAAYLKRDESTVRRWEKEGLPVRRLAHKKKATVYAYTSEIDVWWKGGQTRLESGELAPPRPRHRETWWAIAGVMVLMAVALGLNVAGVRDRLLGRPRGGEIASIAVLPLKNLSGDPSQDYFADGTTEALITELGKISALQVISHQSVSGYRHSDKTVPAIARELGVDAVLEGTVLHSGNLVRITANLVQAVPERHLWAESYEFDRQDVLAIQSRVAREVVGRIRLKLTPQEQARLATSRRVDPEAYEAYLMGRAFFLRPASSAGRARAKEYFERAIEKDPGYAPAYASLAELSVRARGSPTRDLNEMRRQARQWAEKALALDDTLAEAHDALARASQQEWDWAGAEREYRRAIELNPNYSVARLWYAMYLYAMLRFDEAVAQARGAQQLDPVSPYMNTWAGGAYLYGGHREEAMASWRKALELDPGYSDASLAIARTYVSEGKYPQAIAQLQEAMKLKKEREALVVGALAHALARGGQRTEALTLVEELKRSEAEGREYVPPFGLIWAYAGLGDNDQALTWLERASEMHSDRMIWINVDPLLDPLRSDPRFHELVRRMGLPVKGSTRPG